jgi:hypothetical protein
MSFLTSHSFADPVIKSLSGTFIKGQEITIYGTGFGNKNPAKPIVWADFETNGNPTNLSLINSWAGKTNANLTKKNQPFNSIQCVRGDIANSNGSAISAVKIKHDDFSKVYTFVRRMYDFDIDSTDGAHNIKFFRLWPLNKNPTYPNLSFLWINQPGSKKFQVEGMANPNYYSGKAKVPPENTWVIEEFQIKENTGTNMANGVVKYWQNGNLMWNNSDVVTRDSRFPSRWQELVVENFKANTVTNLPIPSYAYMDDIYIDNTWARVMIGNESNFNSCAHREIQIPTSWYDKSIDLVVNHGTFAKGETAYLYVIDTNGSISNGYPITIGGSGGGSDPIPDAPTGLKIID